MADTYEFAEIAVVRAVMNEEPEQAREKLRGFTDRELTELENTLDAVIDLIGEERTREDRS